MQNLDVVVAWVDGSDTALQRKHRKYQTEAHASDAVSDTRFACSHEIYYNIASILKYAAFCRHIFIVTDQQRPAFLQEFVDQGLCSKDKIRLVDHREIFAGHEQHIPTFNSLTIESMLWKIPGLSEFFIYLNDDFFFNSESRVEDFFIANKIVTHGHWQSEFWLKAKLKYRQWLHRAIGKPIQPKNTISQMLGASTLGFDRFFNVHHQPYSMDREIFKEYVVNHPMVLEGQIQHRFRSVEQFNPVSLMTHLKIQRREAVLMPDIPLAYLKNSRGMSRFMQALQREDVKYGCIQSLDQLPPPMAARVQQAMQEKFNGYLPRSVLAQRRQDPFYECRRLSHQSEY